MNFTIKIGTNSYNQLHYFVQHIEVDKRSEHFKVKRGGEEIVIESNRPFFRNRKIMHRRPDYKMIVGDHRNHMLQLPKIYDAIDEEVKKWEAQKD